jgi:uncharacterized protein
MTAQVRVLDATGTAPMTSSEGASQRATRWPGLEMQLHALVAGTAGVRSAVLAERSGEKLASAPLSLDASPQSLAAMSSSVLAIGAAMLDDAGLGACEDMVIESEAGMIVLLRVADSELLLSVVTDRSAMLGEVLWAAKRCGRLLRAAVQAELGSAKR